MQKINVGMPQVFPVACHTDQVGACSTFVAIHGAKSDGAEYIVTALEKGATTIVVSENAVINHATLESISKHNAQLVRVDNTRKALALLSAQKAGYPARKLKLIAITGTKGKTTSSFLLAHILESSGHTVALLSTAGNRINGHDLPASLTTAQPDYLHQFFKLCVEQQVTYVVMEVAAQAVSLYRVHGLLYDALLFTNFSREHGEFYTSMDDYFSAKVALFGQLTPGAPALINADDSSSQLLTNKYDNSFFMSMKDTTTNSVAIRGSFVACPTGRVQGTVCCNTISYAISCQALVGEFNAYNSMGVVGIAHLLGLTPLQVQHGFSTFKSVPGRLAHYKLPNGASCYIDYAHNPSSYRAVLSTLSTFTDHMIIVFGAGGDRDAARRPIMGALAAEYGHTLIITSDNPRSENPEKIIEDICAGIPLDKKSTIIRELDREKAIKKAYDLSRFGTIIALLGKGTDNYQIVGTTKTFFSDAAVVQSLQA